MKFNPITGQLENSALPEAPSDSKQYARKDGAWSEVEAGGTSSFTLKSANFDAAAGQSYAVDTSGGAVTATLPATPAEGDVIEFADAASTWNDFNLILAPNGEKVFGRTSNFSLKTAAILATVVYVDGERGWAVFSGMSVPVLVTAPAISGTETEFQTLTATPGTWTNAPTEYRYQWQLSANGTSGWADIEGATSATYALQAGDTYVRVTVIATNSAGDSDAEPSASSGEIAVLPVPANTALPTLSGTEAKGSTLTATSGTWENGTPTYGYQWQRSANGTTGWADITGATAATHVLVEDDVDAYVRVEVIATNAKGASDPAYSAASGAIAEFSLLTGLVAHWKLNEESGTRADSHGSYDLTDNNSVGYAAGKIGNAADFDTTNYLSCNTPITATSYTNAAWIYCKSATELGIISSSGASSPAPLFVYPGGAAGALQICQAAGMNNGGGNGSMESWNTLVIPLNEWVFVAATYDDSTGKVTHFVNGDSASHIYGNAPFGANVWPSVGVGLIFRDGTTVGNLWDGAIDSATIWNRALSDAEVTQLYNAGTGLDYEAF